MKSHQFSRVLLHTRFELDRFERTLSRLEAHDFPSDVAKILIAGQKRESETADQSLAAIEADYEDDPEGASARLVSEYRKLMQRRRYLEVLEKARSDELPWSLVPSIERLAESILPGRRVLVTTTPDMNYMVSWSRTPDQPVTVYLPKLHRANAFLHVLIGHELFHPAVDTFLPEERIVITPKLRDDCKQLLVKVDGEPDLFSQNRLDAVLKYALEQWERGLTELMCDMGAASLFGPAALWTISGFAASQDLDVPPTPENQFYPPWRMRVKAVLDYIVQVDDGENLLVNVCKSLKNADLNDHVQAIINSLEAEKGICTAEELAKHSFADTLTIKVYEHVGESLERGRDFVKDVASKIADRWSNTFGQVSELLKRLALLVPPSELIDAGKQASNAASLSAIVLACWIERLLMEQNNSLGLSEYRRLCRLMLKAIEDAELKREFADRGAK